MISWLVFIKCFVQLTSFLALHPAIGYKCIEKLWLLNSALVHVNDEIPDEIS